MDAIERLRRELYGEGVHLRRIDLEKYLNEYGKDAVLYARKRVETILGYKSGHVFAWYVKDYDKECGWVQPDEVEHTLTVEEA